MHKQSILGICFLLLTVLGGCATEPGADDTVRHQGENLILESSKVECEFTCSDGKSHTLFCNDPGTVKGCCELVMEHGCPSGTSFLGGTCNGQSCIETAQQEE